MIPVHSLPAGRASQSQPNRGLRIGLVTMPFGSTKYPSVQLGLLQAILARRGFQAKSHYLNLEFAARIGWDLHEHFAWYAPRLAGEWIFARAAFGDRSAEGRDYLAFYGDKLGPLKGFTKYLLKMREQDAPAFIEECLSSTRWDDYDVVGFGSVFEQNCAALALARRIKERHPQVITVFGGANFEDEMGLEYVRAIPWIDYAVIGEGDEAFPALLERLEAGENGAGLPGVAWCDDGALRFEGRAPMVRDLDALPTPDYADFFSTAAALRRPPLPPGFNVEIPFESARGCWWGAKHQCTFCGLNGATLTYRSKSPARVLEEIDELAQRHHLNGFGAVDNILDHRYVTALFGELAERKAGYQLFYEVKANLTRDQLRTLARGGMRRMQPGIESLSTHVLGLMRKGSTCLQNVRFLKWAHYYGIEVVWNLLLGFPGERIEDYERQLALVPLLRHLPPAVAVVAIHLDRFSPYYDCAEELGMVDVHPDPAYASVYPSDVDLARIAYYFSHRAPDTLPATAYAPLFESVQQWFEAWQEPKPPTLTYQWRGGGIEIRDGRQGDPERLYCFSGAAAEVYELCNTTDRSLARIIEHLRKGEPNIDESAVRRDLDRFLDAGLMLEEEGHYLSLALPIAPEW